MLLTARFQTREHSPMALSGKVALVADGNSGTVSPR
jgi:hypothetical protein